MALRAPTATSKSMRSSTSSAALVVERLRLIVPPTSSSTWMGPRSMKRRLGEGPAATLEVNARTKADADRLKKERARTRKAKAQVTGQEAPMLASKGGLSILESKSPGLATRKDYAKRLDKFWAFCTEHGLPTGDAAEMDMVLLDFADLLYLDGEMVDAGFKLLAAVVHRFPNLSRFGDQRMPRFQRALRAWKRYAPTPSRDPMPWSILCGIMACMVRRDCVIHAVFALLLFDTYMRLSEGLNMRVAHLVRPAPRLSSGFRHWAVRVRPDAETDPRKSGVFDDTIALDSKHLPFLGPVLCKLCANRQENDRMFPFSASEFRNVWYLAQKDLGLENATFVPHQLRHGGASTDAAESRREMTEIQRRGGWKVLENLCRYEKKGRLQKKMAALGDDTIEWCVKSSQRVHRLVHGDSSRLPQAMPRGER